MKNIAVFGAGGNTGTCVVRAALDKGLKIRALISDSSINNNNLPPEFEGKVDVVDGDVTNIIDVQATLEGQDAAIVTLGSEDDISNSDSKAYKLSEGLKNIVAVMEALHINVLSIGLTMQLTSAGREATISQAGQRMLKVLDASDLHWVAVDASDVVDQPASGYINRRSLLSRLAALSRQDLASFLVDCLSMPENYQKLVRIASIPRKRTT